MNPCMYCGQDETPENPVKTWRQTGEDVCKACRLALLAREFNPRPKTEKGANMSNQMKITAVSIEQSEPITETFAQVGNGQPSFEAVTALIELLNRDDVTFISITKEVTTQ
jgi:hypothetical protein